MQGGQPAARFRPVDDVVVDEDEGVQEFEADRDAQQGALRHEGRARSLFALEHTVGQQEQQRAQAFARPARELGQFGVQ